MRRLYYWSGSANFGDSLSLYIVEKLTNKKFEKVGIHANKKLVAVGSLINQALMHSDSTIWGTGAISSKVLQEDYYVPYFPINRKIASIRNLLLTKRPYVTAVRGPLTRKVLIDAGYDCPEVYGDPAILLPRFFQPNIEKKFKLGVIAHFGHKNLTSRDSCKDQWIKSTGTKFISISRTTPE